MSDNSQRNHAKIITQFYFKGDRTYCFLNSVCCVFWFTCIFSKNDAPFLKQTSMDRQPCNLCNKFFLQNVNYFIGFLVSFFRTKLQVFF